MTPQKVYELRQRHGLTQTQFARMAYTSRNTVQNWERNRAPVDPARYHIALYKLQKLHPATADDMRLHVERMEKEGWL